MQATTNLLAQALADRDEKRSQTVVSQALAISIAAGVAVMGVIEAFGAQLLQKTIGADGPLLVPVALKVCLCGVDSACPNASNASTHTHTYTRAHVHARSTPASAPWAPPPCS